MNKDEVTGEERVQAIVYGYLGIGQEREFRPTRAAF